MPRVKPPARRGLADPHAAVEPGNAADTPRVEGGARPHVTRATAPAAAALAMLSVLAAACVYVPRTTTVYDSDCKIESSHMTLESHQVGMFGHCANEGCIALLVAAGAVSAATAVVSGSIVVAGNIVYWFEKLGRCDRP